MNTDHHLDRVLGAFNSTEPGAHMEQRLKARLSSPPTGTRPARWTPLWLAASVLCAALVAVVATHQHRATSTIATVEAPVKPAAATAFPPRRTKPSAKLATHAVAANIEAKPVDDAYLPSMPAPPQPLTRQERELRRLATPQSHIMIAEVEPMRELQRREAAEASRRSNYEHFAAALLAPLAATDRMQPEAPEIPQPQTVPLDKNANTENP